MRIALPSLLVAAAFAAGCGDSTGPGDEPSALAAAQELNHIADSLVANGGEATEIGAFRGLAGMVAANGRVSTVTIDVDGERAEFLATAQVIQSAGCPINAFCAAVYIPPMRSFMAWRKDDPRQFVQLISSAGDYYALSAARSDSGISGYLSGPRLLYLDGRGQVYTGGTIPVIDVQTSDEPCTAHDPNLLALWADDGCRLAEFSIGFESTVTLTPFGRREAAPAASHTLAMAQQPVHGAVRTLPSLPTPCTGCPDSTVPPPVAQPPIPPPPGDSLTASLGVSVGSDVALTFTVRNANAAPAALHFTSSQRYDIRVWSDEGSTLVWRWGADKAFTQALGEVTLAAGESVTWTEHMPKPAAGRYRALAYLTSSSHGAASYATFTVP